MRLVSFTLSDGVARPGALLGEEIADLSDVAPDVVSIVSGGSDALAAAQRATASAARFAVNAVALRAPISRPPKFLGIGLNYASHIAESGQPPPEHQVWFNKQSTCVIGSGQPILIPTVSSMVDYEGELGVVIGKRCRHVPAE